MGIKNLYIIGNGFDMHHKIACSYRNYREWLEESHNDLYCRLCDFYEINDDDWWSNFENMLSEVDLDKYSRDIASENYPDFASDEFRDRDYHSAEYTAESELCTLINDVRGTFSEWIVSLDKPDSSQRIYIEKDSSYFINFNYTHTLETTYNISSDNILYIHGEEGKDELVLGHGKNYTTLKAEVEANQPDPPLDLSTPEELEEWYNSQSDYIIDQTLEVAISQIASLQKDVIRIIENNQTTFESFTNIESIHILGLFFSPIDTPYLSEIIRHIDTSKVKWEISAFSEKDKVAISQFMRTNNIPEQLWNLLVKMNEITKYKQLDLFNPMQR
jgi:hypothetical protein